MIKVKLKGNLAKDIEAIISGAKQKKIDSAIAALAEATPIDTGEASKGWHQEGDSIVNRVEHILPLNEGSSKQAPAYFIEETMLSQPGFSPSGTIVRPI
jgi:hypothetical protein